MLYQKTTGQYCVPQPIKKGECQSEYKSFYKTVTGNEGEKCRYSTRLDTYGCGCTHDCSYCYAKSLLSFRNLWDADNPRVADISKIEKVINKLPAGSIVRMGGMSDCFQPLETHHKVSLETINLLNAHGIGYLIVTKSSILSTPEYISVLDKKLAHIQVTVTCMDARAEVYENASTPQARIGSILALQNLGFDVAIRLSPLLEEYLDFDALNGLRIGKCIVEFLRVNSWIKKWFRDIDYSKYTLRQSNYLHLPIEEKKRILRKIRIKDTSVCEDVSEHYEYWRDHFNPNRLDCCNLKKINKVATGAL